MRAGEVFQSAFLRAEDLRGKRVRVVIQEVRKQMVRSQATAPRPVAVMFFAGKQKGLILNRTNWRVLETLIGKADSDEWRGYAITLHVERVSFGKETVEAIRVDAKAGAWPPGERSAER